MPQYFFFLSRENIDVRYCHDCLLLVLLCLILASGFRLVTSYCDLSFLFLLEVNLVGATIYFGLSILLFSRNIRNLVQCVWRTW